MEEVSSTGGRPLSLARAFSEFIAHGVRRADALNCTEFAVDIGHLGRERQLAPAPASGAGVEE